MSPKINSDQSFSLNFTLDAAAITKEFNHQLQKVQANFSYQGFRTGKVPLKIVADSIDTDKLLEETANILISEKYQNLIKENQLKPVVPAKVKITNLPLSLGKDWQIEATSCQLPQVKIDPKYLTQIKSLKSKSPKEILQIIIKSADLKLPLVLIESELSYRLSHLLGQLQASKLSLEGYLEQKKLNSQTLQKRLVEEITLDWTINLALDQIAKEHQTDPKKVIQFLQNLK